MNRLQLLLTKLAEEGSEISQIALKTTQFGLFEKHPDLPNNNLERCHQELNDLLAIVEMLNEEFNFEFKVDNFHIQYKKDRVNKYAEYSKELNLLT